MALLWGGLSCISATHEFLLEHLSEAEDRLSVCFFSALVFIKHLTDHWPSKCIQCNVVIDNVSIMFPQLAIIPQYMGLWVSADEIIACLLN